MKLYDLLTNLSAYTKLRLGAEHAWVIDKPVTKTDKALIPYYKDTVKLIHCYDINIDGFSGAVIEIMI